MLKSGQIIQKFEKWEEEKTMIHMNLRQMRITRRKRQVDAARELGWTGYRYRTVETQPEKTTAAEILELASYYEVSPETILQMATGRGKVS